MAKDNTLTYIGIGAVAVGAYLFLKKKPTAPIVAKPTGTGTATNSTNIFSGAINSAETGLINTGIGALKNWLGIGDNTGGNDTSGTITGQPQTLSDMVNSGYNPNTNTYPVPEGPAFPSDYTSDNSGTDITDVVTTDGGGDDFLDSLG